MSTPAMYRRTDVLQFPNKEQNNKPALPRTSSSSSSSSTTTDEDYQNMAARVACEGLREQYAACIGIPMSQAIHRRLLLDLIEGTPYQYYRYALDEASIAPKPSWRYVLAIVARLHREGVPPESLITIC